MDSLMQAMLGQSSIVGLIYFSRSNGQTLFKRQKMHFYAFNMQEKVHIPHVCVCVTSAEQNLIPVMHHLSHV